VNIKRNGTRSRDVQNTQLAGEMGCMSEHNKRKGSVHVEFLLKKYQQTKSIGDRKRAQRRRQLSNEHFQFIDEAMEADRELTFRQLHSMVVKEYPDLSISVSIIKRACQALGWNSKRTRYCAMIIEINKGKRMTWCIDRVAEGDLELSDVIWTDESSIQLESHRKTVYQKRGQPIRLAGRPKHPPKIQVWRGISARGATPTVMFTGTLTATRYMRILDAAVVPFLEHHYPDGHRFQQDNDLKITSRWADRHTSINKESTGGILLHPVMRIKCASSSRMNFAANVN